MAAAFGLGPPIQIGEIYWYESLDGSEVYIPHVGKLRILGPVEKL